MSQAWDKRKLGIEMVQSYRLASYILVRCFNQWATEMIKMKDWNSPIYLFLAQELQNTGQDRTQN